jgi:hypothetical protein
MEATMIINKTNTNYTFTFFTFHRDGDWNKHEFSFGTDEDWDANEVIIEWYNCFCDDPETDNHAPVDFFSVGCDALKYYQSITVENDYTKWNPINFEVLHKMEEANANLGYSCPTPISFAN